MVSSFFKTATIASLSGIVAYLASYLPFMVAITLEYEMTFLDKIWTCLSMSTSFCFGMMYMSRYEAQGMGMQWTNIWHSPMADDPMSFAAAGIMMVFDGCIYFLIGWYVSNVFPGMTSLTPAISQSQVVTLFLYSWDQGTCRAFLLFLTAPLLGVQVI